MAHGSILSQNPTAQNTLYNNAQTSSIITANNVQGAIDQLFTSVSNGKQQIASAITDKGVSTSGTDSFATMAENIGKISTGISLEEFTYPGYSIYKEIAKATAWTFIDRRDDGLYSLQAKYIIVNAGQRVLFCMDTSKIGEVATSKLVSCKLVVQNNILLAALQTPSAVSFTGQCAAYYIL